MRQAHFFTALFMLFVMVASFDANAQKPDRQPKPKREKVQQLKIAYFTEQLNLTTEEAEKFWPIYHEMNKKVNEKKKAAKQAAKSLKEDSETLTDAEFKQKANEAFDANIEEAKLRKEYHEKIAAVIGYKKAAKLLSLEAQFKRELLKRLTEEEPSKPEPTNE